MPEGVDRPTLDEVLGATGGRFSEVWLEIRVWELRLAATVFVRMVKAGIDWREGGTFASSERTSLSEGKFRAEARSRGEPVPFFVNLSEVDVGAVVADGCFSCQMMTTPQIPAMARKRLGRIFMVAVGR